MRHQYLTESRILSVTLAMIESNNGTQHLNLRAIARALTCAHQSIYRYYANYDLLLEAVAAYGVGKMRTELAERIQPAINLWDAMQIIFVYFMAHEGLFRFLWLEKHAFTEKRVLGIEGNPSEWLRSLLKTVKTPANEAVLIKQLDIAHTYMIGRLAKYFNHTDRQQSSAELLKEAGEALRMIVIIEMGEEDI
ncbi:hypothetical protein KHM83_06150 [Fusibacter paucivorans]|uniref:Transcriptional regulator, TetR family n=1 Tax=Fusibacter paucivorans TaxID=76009 RepID=A0ABS5PN06_9FIRM|nr:hypothetical protein [Fusibacter paucivorans]MBS7526252.1 hypothetical protein [Fusibacter paucivorans]